MWELISFAQGRIRRLCLESLALSPKTPSAIAKASGESLPHISRALKELSERDLVECLTPNLPKNRIYRITDKGKDILSKLKEMD
jgi:DNA-binding PadR family transcriptional regulator